jgi:hypothetical protein
MLYQGGFGSLTGLTGEGFAKVFSSLGTLAQVLLWGLIIMGVFYVFLYWLRFNVPLFLLIERGKGIALVLDRGQRDKKKRQFRALKNRDINFPYPETKYDIQKGKRAALFAFVKNQSATWLSVSDNPHFVPADYNMQRAMLSDFEATWNIVKPKEKFWDKYGQQILWLGSIGVFLVVIILILKRMDNIIELGKSVASAQAAAGKQVVQGIFPYIFMKKWIKKYYC